MTTANDILTIARHYLGSAEGGSNHYHIIDTYNATKPLPRGYTVKYTDDWCATFVSFVGIEAGAPDLYGRECGVERFIDIFKDKGIWLEDGTITPKVGDIICYNWDDGTQPNDGYADHIGFVESVSGGLVTAIEGNKNDSVQRRTISVGAGNIRGYARPNYSGGGNPAPAPIPSKSIAEIAKEVMDGNWGNDPERSQKLKAAGYDAEAVRAEVNRLSGKPAVAPSTPQITVDGYWGNATTKRIQQVLGVTADGLVGPNTYKAIQKAVGVTADGIIGPNTIKAMQRHFGTPVDGRIDKPSMVVKAMQKRLNQGKF
ncbi:CHAP domain-containing protein [Enterococcus nangangensis]|uniref:CHAP domain-containing protein n=1 Tax=Enterococcus nangangensis TaxID=2559926 RepID=UPI0010F66D52|nr:CHAP domain-containing protein [Enterococcus nangangensis]